MLIRFVFLCAVFAFSLKGFSQERREAIELTAGIELKALIPVSFFTMDSVVLQEPNNNFRAVYSYSGGFGFGGVIRARLTDFWNIESGIYYTRRVYNYSITDPATDFSDSFDLRTVGYEIPLKGLVYLQMADNLYMNVALGASADFFASDLEVLTPELIVTAFKTDWIRLAVIGNLGVEYRTEESGYFYLGASIHQPFGDIFTTQVNYFRDRVPPAYFSNGVIDGAYFSVDFRYFLPPKKNDRNKVKYVVPDWKNL